MNIFHWEKSLKAGAYIINSIYVDNKKLRYKKMLFKIVLKKQHFMNNEKRLKKRFVEDFWNPV